MRASHAKAESTHPDIVYTHTSSTSMASVCCKDLLGMLISSCVLLMRSSVSTKMPIPSTAAWTLSSSFSDSTCKLKVYSQCMFLSSSGHHPPRLLVKQS